VVRFWRSRARLRPLIAVAAAYLVVLQMLLTGLGASHLGVAGNSSSGDVFITCLGHGVGPDAGDQGGSGQRPVDQAPCVFCTLAAGGCAILPVEQVVSIVALPAFSGIAVAGDGQVVEFDSPTGHYQRGPPATDFSAG
jgi:hypothetical protein